MLQTNKLERSRGTVTEVYSEIYLCMEGAAFSVSTIFASILYKQKKRLFCNCLAVVIMIITQG